MTLGQKKGKRTVLRLKGGVLGAWYILWRGEDWVDEPYCGLIIGIS